LESWSAVSPLPVATAGALKISSIAIVVATMPSMADGATMPSMADGARYSAAKLSSSRPASEAAVRVPHRSLLALSSSRPALEAAVRVPRRSLLTLLPVLAASALPVDPVAAVAPEPLLKLYFGAGCFWHVQHELVLAEQALLGRGGADITAVSGYAGGTKVASGKDGAKVCYHNPRGIADYGSLGHAEAVQVELPASRVGAFAQSYFALFGHRGIRHDPQDRGGEYRSVLGLPGGQASPLYAAIAGAAAGTPMRLVPGVGDEDDTIGARSVLVYDSDEFPFYPAELYHQFHNDFMGPPYGAAYNNLLPTLYKVKKLSTVGCPDMDPAKMPEGTV
jgi:peptide methionine sulfoxide reductase MsrA